MTEIGSQGTRSTSPWHPNHANYQTGVYKPADAAAFLLWNSEAARLGDGRR
jgi:hypothetical protein